MEDIMVVCKKCGNKAPMSAMKLDYDEKLTICPECVKNKKIHKEIEEKVFHKKEGENREETYAAQKASHKCTSCGYRFKINIDTKTPKSCPYCNSRVMNF